jgi:hypothetical protein
MSGVFVFLIVPYSEERGSSPVASCVELHSSLTVERLNQMRFKREDFRSPNRLNSLATYLELPSELGRQPGCQRLLPFLRLKNTSC